MILYTEPWATANAVPADTIAWGTTWGGAWIDKGYTRDGLRFRMNVPRTNIQVDQVLDPVLRIPTSRELNMETNLAQVNATNLQEASGQPTTQVSTTAAASGTRGHTDLAILGTITDNFLTAGFDIQNPGDLEAVRLIGWKGIVLSEVQLNFQVTDAAQIAFNIGLVPDSGTAGSINPARIATFRDVLAALP